MCDASIQSLFPLNQYRKYAKNSLFLYWDRSSINNVYIVFVWFGFFFSLPILYFWLFYSCFMTEHLTVTSLLIWQMNTASSTNRFKIQGFSSLFCFASFYRHQSIRNGTTPSNCNNTFWLPGGRRWRPPGLTSLTPPPPLPLPKKQTTNKQLRIKPGRRHRLRLGPFVSLVFLLVQRGSV